MNRPLTRIARGGELPLSPAQERIWFLAQIDPDSPAYNMPPVTRRLRGRLEVEALRGALEALVRRHETLRTVFRARGGVPFQLVLEPGRPGHGDLPVLDLRALGERERAAELAARVREAALRPFDLSEGPLLRTLLVRLGDDEHALVIVMHHIVSDGWSLAILWRELCALYSAFARGGEPALPPLPVQYADHASWQRRWIEGGGIARELAYWKRHLSGVPEELALPTRGPRPAVWRGEGGRVSVSLEPAAWARLREVGRAHRASPFMTVLAGLRALLARYTGADDFCIGTPVAGRTRGDVRGLIGCFVNTLVLRSQVDRAAGFATLLAAERRTVLSAMAHQGAPFEAVVDALGLPRSLSRPPLFQVMLALHDLSWEREALGGLVGGPLDSAAELSQLDLEVNAVDDGERLHLWLVYSEDLFERATIEQMATHLVRLLEGVAADPGLPIGEIELLDEEERRRLLVDWGRGAEQPAGGGLVHEAVAEQARRRPEAIAVVSGAASIRYRELDRRANQLAGELRARGVGPDTIVGVCLERSIDFVVATYAVLKAGGAYLPLDPRYPAERLQQFLASAGPEVVVTTSALLEALPALALAPGPGPRPGPGRAGEWIRLDRERDRAAIDARPDRTPPVSIDPENLAFLLYTSGSTGRPKGVATPHRGLANFVGWMNRVYAVGPGDRGTQLSSTSFDAAVGEVWPLLAAGGTVYIVDDELRLDPARLWRALERWGITICEMSVSLLEIAMSLGAPPACLRILRAASDRLTLRPPEGAGYQLINEYGLTETSVDTTWSVVTPAPARGATRLPPIGRPLDNLAIRVLGPDLELVPPGVAGELCVAGPSLARGYLGDPAETAARFIPDPYGPPGARMYRSGDQVRWLPDGELAYLTRIDHQVKVRGFRIELPEIEHVLAAHPAVVQSAVVAREVGEGDRRVVAYVVPAAPGLDLAALRAHVGEKLPDYMVPAAFVVLPALPLTANGKVDTRALPAPALDAAEEAGYLAPRSPVEGAIAGIWSELLGRERIGVHDDFFALGGHSLLVIRVVAHLRERFGVELPVRRIFETPTVAGLAAWLAQAMGPVMGHGREGERAAPPLVAAPRDRDLPLSYAQQRFWLMHQMEAGASQALFAYRIRGRLEVEALRRAIEEVVRRHEVLRTTFPAPDGVPRQHIHEAGRWELPITDLRARDEASREAALAELAREMMRACDPGSGPLLRTGLARLGEEEHALVLSVSHLVFDAGSSDIFWSELRVLYEALAGGRASPLRPLSVQYADYAAWEQRWIQGDELERRLAYWRQSLAGAPAETALPFKRRRAPEEAGADGEALGFLRVDLEAALVGRLRELGQRRGATLFMVLLAAFRALLFRYTGQGDLCFGTLIANRSRRELEGVIGLFLNTLVLRTGVEGELSYLELLEREKATALEAYAHQDTPFELIAGALAADRAGDRAGDRAAARSPLFQVLFSLESAGPGKEREGLSGLAVEPLAVGVAGSAAALYDLTVDVWDHGEVLGIGFAYQARLFAPQDFEQIAGQYVSLLRAVVAEPGRPLVEVPLLGEAERQRVLHGWNATERAIGGQGGEVGGEAGGEAGWVHRRFEAQVDRTPDAVAVRFEGDELTYRALDERCNRLANHLLATAGAAVDRPVAVLLERSLEMVIAVYGIVKAGAAFLPIDPGYPRHRVREILEQSGATRVIGQARFAELVEGTGVEGIWLDLERDREAVERQPCTRPAVTVDGDHLAYVIFTSGSTGQPKGVMNTHGGLRNRLAWMQEALGLSSDDVVLQKTPLSFDVSVWELFWPLMVGARLVIARPEGHRDPAYLGELMRREQVTTLHFVPSMLEAFLAAEPPGAWGSVRRVISSGEALTGRHQARFFAQSGAELINLYGPTEAAIDVSMWRCRRGEGDEDLDVPIGRPVANTRLYVLDPRLEPVPPGAVGELYIAGVQLARGYLGRPALTAERFVPDPHGRAGGRMYRTGDLARTRLDGTIEFLGRIDHQVKLRGFRIELGEIESVLAEHPGVRQCVAVVRKDAGHDELVAYVVPAAGGLDAAAVREVLRERLPEYMVPAVVVLLERLPLTASGKLDRKALPAPAEGDRRRHEPMAPRTDAERALSEIWAQLLGVERVGAGDDFFDLGGHSLLAVQLADRIRRTTGHEVPLRQIFSHSVLSELARWIEARPQAAIAEEEVPVPRPTGLVRSRAYHHQVVPWRLHQAAPENPFVHLTTSLRFEAGVDRDRMERALHALAARHSILRSTYEEIDGELFMQVRPPEPPWLPSLAWEDLSGVSDDERERRAATLVSSFQRRAFDLERGPVLRGLIVQLAGGAAIFSVVAHHVACDGRSSGVLAGELLRLYDGLASPGATAEEILGPPPLQYIDFASYVEELGRAAEGRRQLAYWHERARGAEPTVLPGEPASGGAPARRPGEVWARPAEVVQAFVGGDVSARLDVLTREARATRYMVLLAGFAVSLHTATGQRELCFHSGYMQRFSPGLEGVIGFMANSLLMRVGVEPGQTFREVIGGVREVVLGAYEHGEVAIRPELPPELLRVNFNYADNAAGAAADRDLGQGRGEERGRVEWYEPRAAGPAGPAGPARIWIPFDLLLLVTETREGAALTLHYNRELLDPDRAGGFLRHYAETLARLCAEPDVAVGAARSAAPSAAPSARKQPVALAPVPRGGDLPLSYAQERMWFLHQLDPESAAYNMPPVRRRLLGSLDTGALRGAFEDLIRRHEALRTVFPADGGVPRQRICEPGPLELPITDLRGHAAAEAELVERIGGEQLRPFDLARGPLLRAHLYRLGDEEHVLVVILHHIVSDGLSLAILWKELAALYAARRRGVAADLPPLPVQYADYAVWQRAYLSGERLERQLGYWIERLAGAPEEIALPYRAGDRGVPSSRGAGASVTLDAERWRRLRELGRAHRASPFVTLLASFRALLARRAAGDDLCIGTPVSNRHQEQVRGLIGCFVNTIVLRTRVDREAGFPALLAAERRTVLESLAHQGAPFEALVAALGGKRDRGRTPLFQVLFALQDLAWEREDFGGLVGLPVALPTRSAQVELAVHVFEQPEGLVICFDHAADRFEPGAIEELARDYVRLLERVALDPERAIAGIRLEGSS